MATLETRLQLLSTDVAEERFNLVRALIVSIGVLFCFQLGVVLAVLFVISVLGEAHRTMAIGTSAAALLLAAIGGVLWLRHWLKTRPPLFAATIGELRKDRERMTRNP